MYHESRQTDSALFNRLCPRDKNGQRHFAPSMIGRLERLGITERDPDKLNDEEKVDLPVWTLTQPL